MSSLNVIIKQQLPIMMNLKLTPQHDCIITMSLESNIKTAIEQVNKLVIPANGLATNIDRQQMLKSLKLLTTYVEYMPLQVIIMFLEGTVTWAADRNKVNGSPFNLCVMTWAPSGSLENLMKYIVGRHDYDKSLVNDFLGSMTCQQIYQFAAATFGCIIDKSIEEKMRNVFDIKLSNDFPFETMAVTGNESNDIIVEARNDHMKLYPQSREYHRW